MGLKSSPSPGLARRPLSPSLKPYHPLRCFEYLPPSSKREEASCPALSSEKSGPCVGPVGSSRRSSGEWRCKRHLGIPLAIWSLGSDIWIYGRLPIFKRWVRKILNQSTYCFADGFSLAEEVRALSGRSCSFLPTTRILPKEGLPKLPFDPHKIHYLFIGRYHKNKGPDVLLEAIHLIDPEILSQVQFHFFGSGPSGKGFEEKSF